MLKVKLWLSGFDKMKFVFLMGLKMWMLKNFEMEIVVFGEDGVFKKNIKKIY